MITYLILKRNAVGTDEETEAQGSQCGQTHHVENLGLQPFLTSESECSIITPKVSHCHGPWAPTELIKWRSHGKTES